MKKLLLALLLLFAPVEAYAAASGANSGAVVKKTGALAQSLVLRTTCNQNCVLTSFEVSQDGTLSAAPWTILIFDGTADPGNVAVTPTKCYTLPTGTTSFSAAFNTPPIFLTGITIVVSTGVTCFTEAGAGAHAFISGDSQ